MLFPTDYDETLVEEVKDFGPLHVKVCYLIVEEGTQYEPFISQGARKVYQLLNDFITTTFLCKCGSSVPFDASLASSILGPEPFSVLASVVLPSPNPTNSPILTTAPSTTPSGCLGLGPSFVLHCLSGLSESVDLVANPMLVLCTSPILVHLAVIPQATPARYGSVTIFFSNAKDKNKYLPNLLLGGMTSVDATSQKEN